MPETAGLLLGTVVLRPYVFAFLAAYIVAGCLHIGWKKTLAYVPVGYALAWISEFCSINFGFPYGDYYYIPSTVGRELWVMGVPFMDSLSYVFLSYCSYSLALFLLSPIVFSSGKIFVLENAQIRRSLHSLFLGAFLFVLLDVVIDPVALLGDRWFLGKIYGYRHTGYYFGIPMSNFGGWFVVGIVLMAAQQVLDRARILARGKRDSAASLTARLLGPMLYLAVMLFNIAVTFRIGEYQLGFVDLVILSTLLVMIFSLNAFKFRNAAATDHQPSREDPQREFS